MLPYDFYILLSNEFPGHYCNMLTLIERCYQVMTWCLIRYNFNASLQSRKNITHYQITQESLKFRQDLYVCLLLMLNQARTSEQTEIILDSIANALFTTTLPAMGRFLLSKSFRCYSDRETNQIERIQNILNRKINCDVRIYTQRPFAPNKSRNTWTN